MLHDGHIASLELLDLMAADLRPTRVIYDIGANVGTWARLAHSQFPDAQIHAFEPLQFHLPELRMFGSEIDKLHIHPVALGSQPGSAMITVTDFSDASSLLPLAKKGADTWGISEKGHEVIRVERLDDWIAANQLAMPDCLKLDVQGFELEVLKGARQTLPSVRNIIVELSFDEFYEGQPGVDELFAELMQAGFLLRAVGKGVRLGQPLLQIDALFSRGSP
ncbi:MAG: FkbM family methyltransferase [Pseudomonadota bacterium]